MAKKKDEPNKSQAIRDLVGENPKLKAGEIVEALSKKGIAVQAGLVYLVRGKMRARKRRAKREEVSRMTGNGKSDTIAVIRRVKDLAEQAGGMHKLKQLVDILAE